MLFKFDITKLTVEYVYISCVTEALGGSCTIVENYDVFNPQKYTTKRKPLPFAVARAYKKRTKKGKFVVPIPVAITSYEGTAVCIESAKRVADGWTCNSEHMIRVTLRNLLKNDTWYTDGAYIYKLPDDITTVSKHTPLIESGRLYAISVSALSFATMFDPKLGVLTQTKSIVAYQYQDQVILTPPVWNNILDIRKENLKKITEEDSKSTEKPKQKPRFDNIDQHFMVNLEFVLNAAKTIGGVWGYDKVDYLQLERYMIDLSTVNLPNVPKANRATYDTKLTFLQSFVWIMGFIPKCKNLSQFNDIRALLKVLCKYGLFNKQVAEQSLSGISPPIVNERDALKNIKTTLTDSQQFLYWTNKRKFNSDNAPNHGNQILATGSD